eukprot:SAG11_NODE_2588_length_3192_cov_8.847721_3_plen_211_part_00
MDARMPTPPPGAAKRLSAITHHLRRSATGDHYAQRDIFAQAAAADDADLSSDDFYKVLRLSADASDTEIKKAFRRLARKHHPDKGGDAAAFQRLSRAHEVLSDPALREVYDAHGLAGLEATEQGAGAPGAAPRDFRGGGGGGGGGDVFSMFGAQPRHLPHAFAPAPPVTRSLSRYDREPVRSCWRDLGQRNSSAARGGGAAAAAAAGFVS